MPEYLDGKASSLEDTRDEAPPTGDADATKRYSYPLLGKVVGGVQVTGVISSGGMCVIYSGKDLKGDTESPVALKVLKQEYANRKNTVARFRAEPELVNSLGDHPNILKIIRSGFDQENGIDYIISKQVKQDLTKAQLSLKDTSTVILKIGRALEYAHSKGVIHRDVKPANILIDEENNPYLIDFGIGKIMEEDSGLTMHDRFLGTPDYMSPEQAQISKTITGAADLYALALTAYAKHSNSIPRERATTSTKDGSTPAESTELMTKILTYRKNPNIFFEHWLNEKIEQAGMPPVSDEYEDLLTIHDIKNPTDRPSISFFNNTLEALIVGNKLEKTELTPEQKAENESARANAQAREKELSETKTDDKDLQGKCKIKLQLAQTLETIATLTPRTQESRGTAMSAAHLLYSELQTVLCQDHPVNPMPGITLAYIEPRIEFTKFYSQVEASRKRHWETSKIKQEIAIYSQTAEIALIAQQYEIACENLAKIDPNKIPEELKPIYEKISRKFARAVESELESAKPENLEEATKRYKNASLMAKTLNDPQLKEMVQDFYTKNIQERQITEKIAVIMTEFRAKYEKATLENDFYNIYILIGKKQTELDGIGKELPGANSLKDAKASLEACLEKLGDKKGNISLLVNLIEQTETLEKKLKEEIGAEGDLSEEHMRFLEPEKIEELRKSIEGKRKTLDTLDETNIGPEYKRFQSRIASFLEDLEAQVRRTGIRKEKPLIIRWENLDWLIRYHHDREDRDLEKGYLLMRRKWDEERLKELD